MNDFNYDCMQKKRIARGAFAHINRKRGGCSLPSDTLTEKQRKEKNGEVKSYNITRPMPLEEFKEMLDDLKREYLRNIAELRSGGHIPCRRDGLLQRHHQRIWRKAGRAVCARWSEL